MHLPNVGLAVRLLLTLNVFVDAFVDFPYQLKRRLPVMCIWAVTIVVAFGCTDKEAKMGYFIYSVLCMHNTNIATYEEC